LSKKPATAKVSSGRVRPSFGIVPEDVKNEYIRMAPQIARATEEYSEALSDMLEKKQQRDEIYAALYQEVCCAADKKPAENTIKYTILAAPSYQDACRAYSTAEVRKAQISGDLEALRTKRDMLVSLGAHVRIELKADGGGTHDEVEDEVEDED